MSRNGSGVYQPSATGYPAVASTTIESAKYNAVIADIATALTLSIAANGETTVTANIPLAGYKITGLGDATADTDALNRQTGDARYAVLTGPTFTGAVTISAAVPYLLLSETGVTADNGKWAFLANGEELSIRAYSDDLGTVAQPILITRTGTTVDAVAITATAFTVNTVDLAPASGNFTMELATASSGGSVLASGTAYWKRVGGVVTMRIPYLVATTTDTSIYLRGIPAECQPSLTGTYYQCPLVPGKINGTDGAVQIDIYEGTAYWLLEGITAAFAGGSDAKGVGVTSSFGPVITYQVTD